MMAFQLASFTGVPLTIYLNGLLLRRVNVGRAVCLRIGVERLGSFGDDRTYGLDMTSVVLVGLVMGMATGFHWSEPQLISRSRIRMTAAEIITSGWRVSFTVRAAW